MPFLLDRRCTGEPWVAFFSRSSGRRPDKVRTVYVFVSSVGPDEPWPGPPAVQVLFARGLPVLAAAGSLFLRFLCRLRPGWFPVPDSVTEAVLRPDLRHGAETESDASTCVGPSSPVRSKPARMRSSGAAPTVSHASRSEWCHDASGCLELLRI